MFNNIEQFKEYCEKFFKSTSPIVDKDEARAGVLGFHPFALLVIALDYIEKLEKQTNSGVKVGVAVFIIKYENNIKKILFGKRKNTTTGEGCWQLPGGRMEKWEDPIDTGIREIKEETTLDIKNLKFIDFTNDIFNEEDEHWIILFYETKDFKGTPKVVEDKCSEWQWFSENNFPTPLFLPTRKIWNKIKDK